MADEGLQGITDALRKLEAIGGENGKFVKQSMRTVLREAAKPLATMMRSIIKQQSGDTRAAVKVRAAPRSRVKVGMLVGVFYMGDKFYAGWENFGHRIGKRSKGDKLLSAISGQRVRTSGKQVKGSHWTERIKHQLPATQEQVAGRLKEELEAIASGRSA